jgi:CDP-diacylglycerol--glycerol-3-phosphate 3-phosphatidyltransferase
MLWLNYMLAVLFVALGITDFFDGYFARKLGQVTVIGAALDPIADKFLFYSSLIALLGAHKIFFYWVIILIGREFFIMGLRIIALEHKFSIPVSFLSKCKTVFEMACIAVIIINPHQHLGIENFYGWNGLEACLLIVTIFMSLLTAYWYYQDFIIEMQERIIFKEDAHGHRC